MVFNSLRGKTLKNNRLVVQRIKLLQDNISTAKVTAFRTCDLAFYFAVQEKHWNAVENARMAILKRWRDLPLWLPPIHPARPHAPTFADLLLEIPQGGEEFERLPLVRPAAGPVMFLLDTDVLSALRRRDRNPTVVRWVDARQMSDMYISVVTVGEIERGITQQRRRNPTFAEELANWLGRVLFWYGDPSSSRRYRHSAPVGSNCPHP